jgi:hypothetical protein
VNDVEKRVGEAGHSDIGNPPKPGGIHEHDGRRKLLAVEKRHEHARRGIGPDQNVGKDADLEVDPQVLSLALAERVPDRLGARIRCGGGAAAANLRLGVVGEEQGHGFEAVGENLQRFLTRDQSEVPPLALGCRRKLPRTFPDEHSPCDAAVDGRQELKGSLLEPEAKCVALDGQILDRDGRSIGARRAKRRVRRIDAGQQSARCDERREGQERFLSGARRADESKELSAAVFQYRD